jgi:hypothetical protein
MRSGKPSSARIETLLWHQQQSVTPSHLYLRPLWNMTDMTRLNHSLQTFYVLDCNNPSHALSTLENENSLAYLQCWAYPHCLILVPFRRILHLQFSAYRNTDPAVKHQCALTVEFILKIYYQQSTPVDTCIGPLYSCVTNILEHLHRIDQIPKPIAVENINHVTWLRNVLSIVEFFIFFPTASTIS